MCVCESVPVRSEFTNISPWSIRETYFGTHTIQIHKRKYGKYESATMSFHLLCKQIHMKVVKSIRSTNVGFRSLHLNPFSLNEGAGEGMHRFEQIEYVSKSTCEITTMPLLLPHNFSATLDPRHQVSNHFRIGGNFVTTCSRMHCWSVLTYAVISLAVFAELL